MKTGSIVLLSLAAFLAISCGNRHDTYSETVADYAMEEQISVEAAPAVGHADIVPNEENIPSPAADKKIVKQGRMGIDVDDLAKAKGNVTSLVAKHNGYFASERYHNSSTRLSYYLVIRIPAKSYEAFVSELENAPGGMVLYKEIDARDVTEEYLDIETRLTNKRAYLARYRELVKRANTIKDVLEVERQIRALEEEIESAEGRLRYMGDQVSHSTLSLDLAEDIEYVPAGRESARDRFKGAIATGWTIVVEIFYGLMTIWPLLLIGAGLFVIIRMRSRNRGK